MRTCYTHCIVLLVNRTPALRQVSVFAARRPLLLPSNTDGDDRFLVSVL